MGCTLYIGVYAKANIVHLYYQKLKNIHPEMHFIQSFCNEPKATSINYYKTNINMFHWSMTPVMDTFIP